VLWFMSLTRNIVAINIVLRQLSLGVLSPDHIQLWRSTHSQHVTLTLFLLIAWLVNHTTSTYHYHFKHPPSLTLTSMYSISITIHYSVRQRLKLLFLFLPLFYFFNYRIPMFFYPILIHFFFVNLIGRSVSSQIIW